jgi:hypothetical protein
MTSLSADILAECSMMHLYHHAKGNSCMVFCRKKYMLDRPVKCVDDDDPGLVVVVVVGDPSACASPVSGNGSSTGCTGWMMVDGCMW